MKSASILFNNYSVKMPTRKHRNEVALFMTKVNDLLFPDKDEEENATSPVKDKKEKWKILIVDDEADIHRITKLAFGNFEFENKSIEFLSAYSGKEAKKLMEENKGIALVLLDVVMEEEDAGLKFVKYLREEAKNGLTRIIIRTGQPGQAPEKKVIIEYDINDYKEKTELTENKFYTALVMALRSFRDLLEIEKSKADLYQLMQASDRFVPHAFINILHKENITQINLGDHVEEDTTVLFLDIRSFTRISENLTPLENFAFINSLFSYLEPAIIQQGGFIDKYIGDSVMALFFGTSDKAVSASITMLKNLKNFNQERKQAGKIPVDIGISLNSGVVALGTIGFNDRMDCTAISDVVNTAAKLEKMNKILGTQLLITEATLDRIENKKNFHFRRCPISTAAV
ncbi:MAG: response regulator, partial [Gammaproteobacteria bacterium]